MEQRCTFSWTKLSSQLHMYFSVCIDPQCTTHSFLGTLMKKPLGSHWCPLGTNCCLTCVMDANDGSGLCSGTALGWRQPLGFCRLWSFLLQNRSVWARGHLPTFCYRMFCFLKKTMQEKQVHIDEWLYEPLSASGCLPGAGHFPCICFIMDTAMFHSQVAISLSLPSPEKWVPLWLKEQFFLSCLAVF